MNGYWEEESKKGLRITIIVNSHCYCYFDCYHGQLLGGEGQKRPKMNYYHCVGAMSLQKIYGLNGVKQSYSKDKWRYHQFGTNDKQQQGKIVLLS